MVHILWKGSLSEQIIVRFCIPKFGKRFGTRERGRKCTRRFSMVVRKKLALPKILFGKCSCRRALASDLFKEVSYLGMAFQASSAILASYATSDCSCPLSFAWSVPTVIGEAETTMAIRIKFDLAMELVFLRRLRRQVWPSTLWAIKVR